MRRPAVPLTAREHDYAEAELAASAAAGRWLDGKAAGRVTAVLDAELDAATQKLRAAARRLERTRRRLTP